MAVVIPEGLASLDADRLRPPVHTVIALEEPENSLAPKYLGRIIRQLRAACDFGDVQSLIATHAPTVLRRVDPHSIRFLRLKPCTMREFDDGRCAHDVPDTAGRSFTSGIAQVAAALAVTTGLEVGLGIAPAAVRNAMYLAMELSAVTRMSGGRFHAGIGHGMPGWLTQVGQHPASLMTCLREVAESVGALLNGQQLSYAGEHVHLDAVSLTHPPLVAPPLSLGVRGPKGIELAADLGLGVILAEGSPPEYVAEVRKRLGPAAHITVFVWSNMDPDDVQRGSEALAPIVEEALSKPYLVAQLGDLYGTSGVFDAIRRLTVSGDAQTCRAAIDRFADSGADSVVLQPIHRNEEEQIERIGEYLLRRRDSPVLA